MKSLMPSSCPVAFSLDIFGDKWSLIILRDMLFAEKSHFHEFRNSPEKIASNILSARLEAMIQAGLITKQADPANKSAAIYTPTKKALDLLPMFIELMRWGQAYNPLDDKNPELQQVFDDPIGAGKRIVARYTT